jgi:A/G-specific adenine glycosylase
MRRPSKREISLLQSNLVAWFASERRPFPWRRPNATVFERIVSEVLLQRTRAEVVARFLPQFLRSYPSWNCLAKAREKDLQKRLQPLGLWRRRASSLRRLAIAMAETNGRYPQSRAEIESLPGVGQYISNAIMLFRHGQPEPLLDVNMVRVLERCFGKRRLADIRYDSDLQEISRLVVSGPKAVEVNWAILDLASLICIQRTPRCGKCPLQKLCDVGRVHAQSRQVY